MVNLRQEEGMGMFKILFFLFVIGSQAAQADSLSHECGKLGSFKYCIDRDPASKSSDVLYFFHGAFGDENSWSNHDFANEIQMSWKRLGVELPSVISVSRGSFWLLSENTGLLQEFLTQTMPQIEAKLPKKVNRRNLMGLSMGSFNASMLLLKSAVRFDHAVFACPAFPTVGPFDPYSEVQSFMGRHKDYINHLRLNTYLSFLKKGFGTKEEWEKHDPMNNLRKIFHLGSKLHVSCGDRDEYGFNEGAKSFAQLAALRGIEVHWESFPGQGHCAMNPYSIAWFLME